MLVPENPKIYHIVHADRLPSILTENGLVSDAQMATRPGAGTTIGMSKIKERRLNELTLNCYPDVYVGQCVPFYFCPRSIMLYMMYRGNDTDIAYRGGQEPIIHLEADLHKTVRWAGTHQHRWAFTLSNAGSSYVEDRNNLTRLGDINWESVQARSWQEHKEGKQAEFLIENRFSWELVERIGVYSQNTATQVMQCYTHCAHKPRVEILKSWYY